MQEDQKFKVILGYIPNSRPPGLGRPCLKTNQPSLHLLLVLVTYLPVFVLPQDKNLLLSQALDLKSQH